MASSKDGFDVSFFDAGDEYAVSFDGWHQRFERSNIKSALGCFGFGLSGKCRQRVSSRGGFDYKWTLETFEDGNWIS